MNTQSRSETVVAIILFLQKYAQEPAYQQRNSAPHVMQEIWGKTWAMLVILRSTPSAIPSIHLHVVSGRVLE
ncbi:MAG: hypothetical protein D4R40_00175 [Nitrosomonadaceae bacterium]|nr:MAG: hypothetical protein D4R40_00175 [Nitrosomonadaceae bacterium]